MNALIRNMLAIAVLLAGLGIYTATAASAAETVAGYQRYVPGIGWVQLDVLLPDGGGRVSWYRGVEHARIAYDSIVAPGRTEVFTINPDGSDRRCVTCASPGLDLARRLSDRDHYGEFVGQPEWYPLGGDLLMIQVENEYSNHTAFEHMSWGINNDLWMLKVDGSEAQKVYDTPKDHAALHPHFNRFGTELIFASKVPSSNPWTRWHIHHSDVDAMRPGEDRLANHAFLQPAGPGFYETHGFSGPLQGWMTFSYTPGGIGAYVQDSYATTADGGLLARLTYDPSSWTEHATYAPSGASFAYNSSSPFNWRPSDGASTLRTELFLHKDGMNHQITAMNRDRDPLHYQYVVSDFDWDRDSRRLVAQVAVNSIGGIPLWVELWIVTFPGTQ